MSITYTPSTNFGAKDSLPTNDSNKVIRGSEFTTEFVAIQTAFSNAAPAASPTFTGTVTISSVDINGGTIDGVTIGGSSAGAGTFTNLTATGTTTLAGASTSADITFGDNDKAVFGAGSDLQIYHDGSNSFIDDAGIGDLYIRADNDLYLDSTDGTARYAQFTKGGAATFRYNNSNKLATTATGIDVTGTLTVNNFASLSSTTLTIGGEGGANGVINSDESIYLNIDSNNNETGKVFRVGTDSTSTGGKSIALFSDNGDISFYEDTGTTPKLFWDASAEALGIGTTSPTDYIHIHNTADSTALIHFTNGATGSATSDGFKAGVTVGGDAYLRQREAANLLFYTSDTERARIDSSGRLLVGTTAQGTYGGNVAELRGANISTLGGNVTGNLALFTTNSQAANVGAVLSLGGVYSGATPYAFGAIAARKSNSTSGNAEGYLQFYTTDVTNAIKERMRIDSSGNVMVGATSNAQTSGIIHGEDTDSTVLGAYAKGTTSSAIGYYCKLDSANALYAYWNCNGVNTGTISTNGTTTSYNISSDYRLKDVDGPITNSGAYIDALKPVQGSWKADGSRFIGLIAHEVQEVSETQIATGEKDGEEMQGMDYSSPELIANLIAEIQSLRARVAQLEGA